MNNNFDTVREALTKRGWATEKESAQALVALAQIEADHFTASDMASAAAQGHRDGVASVVQAQEPFGYFRPEPFGWTDCAETDEGAIALYTAAPVAQQPPCPLCNYQHGHAIGCENNPVDIALEARAAQQPQARPSFKEWTTDYVRDNLHKLKQPQAEAVPPKRATGWAAPKDRYTTPVLFNPYTGEPRNVLDVQSDPQGILIVPPGAQIAAAQGAKT